MIRHLIVDAGSISYWKLFSLISSSKGYDDLLKKTVLMQESDDNFPLWKSAVETELVNLINMFNPHKMTIACDGKKLWRREIYKEYKATRAKNRQEYPIDWGKFFNTRDEYFKQFSNLFPTRTILIDECEADDVIAVLTKTLHKDEEIIAITGDADIHQLFQFSNFRCYDAKKRVEVTDVDGADIIKMKVLSGDKGDNIHALRKRLGPATARKILEECEGNIYAYCEENGLLEEYMLNQKLVNFAYIPRNLKEQVVLDYQNVKIHVPDQDELLTKTTLDYSEILNLMNRNLFKVAETNNSI